MSLGQPIYQRLDFAPMRFGERGSAIATPGAHTALQVLDGHEFFPNIELSGFSPMASKWIFFKQRDDDMIEVRDRCYVINGCRVDFAYLWRVIKMANSEGMANRFQPYPIVSPHTDMETKSQLLISIVLAIYTGRETTFASHIATEKPAKLISNFQIKTKSFLHDDLPKMKPTNPLLLLLARRADGKRTDGLIRRTNRPPFEHLHHTTKWEPCQ